jgi:bacterioferritin
MAKARSKKATKSKAPSGRKPAARVQGEGDYDATRRYLKDVESFVHTADIERAARAAAPRNRREAAEMAAAEAAGRARAQVPAPRKLPKELRFLRDVESIRRKAREQLTEGAVTKNYKGSVEQAIELLNHAVATEIVCVLRYKYHAVVATGISSDAVKEEFAEHAKEEEEHLDLLCERINQLGGKPQMNPEGLLSRASSQYVEGENLVDMIKENLIAERIAIETYRDMVRYFGDKDPTTRIMLEGILAQEEEHANDMHDLLVQHEGRPMLAE